MTIVTHIWLRNGIGSFLAIGGPTDRCQQFERMADQVAQTVRWHP